MKREKTLENLRTEKAIVENSIRVAKSIPLDKPLIIHCYGYTWDTTHKTTIHRTRCAVIGITFNKSSIRCKMIAVEKDVYPFAFDHNKDIQALKFRDIIKWELLDREDLPLLVGYKFTYDELGNLLKKEPEPEIKVNKDKFFQFGKKAVIKVGKR